MKLPNPKHLLYFIAVLYFVDGLFTWMWFYQYGPTMGANPISRYLLDFDPTGTVFLAIKGALACVLVILGARARRIQRMLVFVLVGVLLIYVVVNGMHLLILGDQLRKHL